MKSLVLLGCGGHARSVADVALSAGFETLLFVDENAKPGEIILGFPAQCAMPASRDGWEYMPCAGDNRRRAAQIRQLAAAELPLATVISPTATVGAEATVSGGCFVGHHAHIGPSANIGAGCIINTAAVVEHECVIGECSHIAVRGCVAGRSRLGDGVFLGAGAVVIDSISVASNVIIGAGGVVVAAIHSPGSYVGVPVRRIADLD
jgi:sugar O-acyltransferase (sialic acid O-acetyltransferase NeuD family)